MDRGTWIEFAGACSVSESRISCWNADGVVDSSLSEFIAAPFLVGNFNQIPMKLQRVTKVFLFRSSGLDWPSYRAMAPSEYLDVERLNTPRGPVDAVFIAVEPQTKSVSIDVLFNYSMAEDHVMISGSSRPEFSRAESVYKVVDNRPLTREELSRLAPRYTGFTRVIRVIDAASGIPVFPGLSARVAPGRTTSYQVSREYLPWKARIGDNTTPNCFVVTADKPRIAGFEIIFSRSTTVLFDHLATTPRPQRLLPWR